MDLQWPTIKPYSLGQSVGNVKLLPESGLGNHEHQLSAKRDEIRVLSGTVPRHLLSAVLQRGNEGIDQHTQNMDKTFFYYSKIPN